MSDRGLVGFFYMKNDLTIEKLEGVYEEINSKFPLIKLSSPIDYSARVVFDPERYYVKNKFSSMILDDTISIGMRNEERRIHDYEGAIAIFNGRRQVQLHIETNTIEDFNAIFMDELETGYRLLPIIYTVGKNLDAFFGIVKHISGYEILTDNKIYLSPLYNKYIKGGQVPNPLLKALREKGIALSDKALIVQSKDLNVDSRKKELLIIDGDRVFEPQIDDSRTLPIFETTKKRTLKNLDYLAEILKWPYGIFYLDNRLAEDIGLEVLCPWAGTLVHLDKRGYLVENELGGNPDNHIWMKEHYQKKIHLKILKRLRQEYSELGCI